MPKACGPLSATTARKPAAARSSASSQVAGRSAPPLAIAHERHGQSTFWPTFGVWRWFLDMRKRLTCRRCRRCPPPRRPPGRPAPGAGGWPRLRSGACATARGRARRDSTGWRSRRRSRSAWESSRSPCSCAPRATTRSSSPASSSARGSCASAAEILALGHPRGSARRRLPERRRGRARARHAGDRAQLLRLGELRRLRQELDRRPRDPGARRGLRTARRARPARVPARPPARGAAGLRRDRRAPRRGALRRRRGRSSPRARTSAATMRSTSSSAGRSERGLLPLSEAVLVVSGRLGFEIVQKAIVAGIPLVVSVGAASSIAVHLAEQLRPHPRHLRQAGQPEPLRHHRAGLPMTARPPREKCEKWGQSPFPRAQ